MGSLWVVLLFKIMLKQMTSSYNRGMLRLCDHGLLLKDLCATKKNYLIEVIDKSNFLLFYIIVK